MRLLLALIEPAERKLPGSLAKSRFTLLRFASLRTQFRMLSETRALAKTWTEEAVDEGFSELL